jgi:hypothetical protein
MNHIRRILAAVATLAGALLSVAAAPAAGAVPLPLPPHGGSGSGGAGGAHGTIRVIVTGGMPGWQIALIAAAAALAAAVVAVLADRAWVARRTQATTA